jgi:hypothetical protein
MGPFSFFFPQRAKNIFKKKERKKIKEPLLILEARNYITLRYASCIYFQVASHQCFFLNRRKEKERSK